jgi:Uncharacterized protein conserved in bacteria (DUF2330)
MRRMGVVLPIVLLWLAVGGPALACGGLVAPNGSVQLVRTTTLAAYHQGVEHYVTSFEFSGSGEFGSIVPLPGVPTNVIRGGDWTLQRLVQETQPPVPAADVLALEAAAATRAVVLLRTKIDALDVVVLKGGSFAVGRWAAEHGFLLPPDAPEVLEFYARRSPVFMAVRYDTERAADQGLSTGDGTPVHVVIPTTNPWVPLRILGLGAPPLARVQADVYLLTAGRPALLPTPIGASLAARVPKEAAPGLVLERSESASPSLLRDLRSDKGMSWLPSRSMWLTYLRIDAKAGDLTYDLAVDASGAGHPSTVAAGLPAGASPARSPNPLVVIGWSLAVLLALMAAAARERGRARPAAP